MQQATAALRDAGLDPTPTHYSFCTNGSYAAGVCGIPTIGFGVGLEAMAHQVSLTDDEFKLVFSRLGDRLRIAGTAELNGYDRDLNRVRCEAIVKRTEDLRALGVKASKKISPELVSAASDTNDDVPLKKVENL